jgi:hypothetical protein
MEKPKKNKLKLELHKSTIAILSNEQLAKIKGGQTKKNHKDTALDCTITCYGCNSSKDSGCATSDC